MKLAKNNLVPATILSLFAFWLLSPSAAQAQERRVLVINETSQTIVSLYATNITTEHWGPNLFNLGMLSAGDLASVNVDDGSGQCRFDLKIVLSNGIETVRHDVDVCNSFAWVIRPGSL